MKKRFMIGTMMAVMLAACSSQTEEPAVGSKEPVRVEVQSPGYYAGINASSRAVDNYVSGILPGKTVYDLPADSTLWLIYEQQTEDGTGYGAPVLKPYVVKAEAGYNSLYACTHSESGDVWTINKNEVGAPLYLEEGTYRFRMLSPAVPVKVTEDGNKLQATVGNGIYIYATDSRYTQTEASETTISYDGSTQERVQYIQLNPMIAQVARINFSISKGDNVYSLEMLDAGIEISGIQTPAEEEYNWTFSTELADTLVMERGNKRGIVRIKGNRFVEDAEGALRGETGILPTYAESNSVVLLINMAVNGVPTQYETMLNGMTFWHACSYNLNLKVSLKDNIVVMTWQNQSWVTEQEW